MAVARIDALPGLSPEVAVRPAWEDWFDAFDRTSVPPPPPARPAQAWDPLRVLERWLVSVGRHPTRDRSGWREVIAASGPIGRMLFQDTTWAPTAVLRAPHANSLKWLAAWLDLVTPEIAAGANARWPGRSGPDGEADWAFEVLSEWWCAQRGQKAMADAATWMTVSDALAEALSRLGLDRLPPWGLAWTAEHQQNRLVAALVAGEPFPELPEDLPAARRVLPVKKSLLWSGTVESLIALAPSFIETWAPTNDARLDAWALALSRASQSRSPQFLAALPSQEMHWARWGKLVSIPKRKRWMKEEEYAASCASAHRFIALRDAWKMTVALPAPIRSGGGRLRL